MLIKGRERGCEGEVERVRGGGREGVRGRWRGCEGEGEGERM